MKLNFWLFNFVTFRPDGIYQNIYFKLYNEYLFKRKFLICFRLWCSIFPCSSITCKFKFHTYFKKNLVSWLRIEFFLLNFRQILIKRIKITINILKSLLINIPFNYHNKSFHLTTSLHFLLTQFTRCSRLIIKPTFLGWLICIH